MYNQVDLNIFSGIMLLSVYLYTSKFIKREAAETRYFTAVIHIMIYQVLVESICFVIGEIRIPGPLRYLTYTLEFSLMFLSVFLGFYWVRYTYLYIYRKPKFENKLLNIVLYIPVVIVAILLITNYKTGYIYTVNEINYYKRGPYFVVLTALSAVYTIFSMVFIISGRRRLSKKEIYIFIFYNVLPVAGIALQLAFRGTTFFYPSIAYMLVLLCVFLENKIAKLDHLTKVYSRTFLDAYLDLLEAKKQAKLTIAFIDLDEFKQINDKYGHAEGDFALEKFASILNASFKEEDIVARFGGDEFVVIMHTNDREKVDGYFAELSQTLSKVNKVLIKKKGYEIKYSVGLDQITNGYHSPKELLRAVDGKMYEEKLRKKVNRKSLA